MSLIEMNSLAHVYNQLEACEEADYNSENLQVKFHGHTFLYVCVMTADYAFKISSLIPLAAHRIPSLMNFGFVCDKLAQQALNHSGVEAHRCHLATESFEQIIERTLYSRGQSTKGLSYFDVHELIYLIQRFMDKWNSVACIKYSLDFIRCLDWIIEFD